MTRHMRLFPRYRRPSLKTVLGVTRAKRQLKTRTGYYQATRILRAPYNAHRRVLRRMGYYSGPLKFLRFLGRSWRKARS